jgi:glycosyltransferase involved in cell wall biosynthesis
MRSRPDVALISLYPADGVRHGGRSGVASYAANLAQGLSEAGASVHVLAPRAEGARPRWQDGDVYVERAFARGPGAGPAAAAAALRTGAPVVHLQFELFLYGGASALPGLLAALSLGRAGRSRKRRPGTRRPGPSQPSTVVTAHQVVDPASVDAGFVELHGIRVPAVLARTGLAAVQRAIGALPDAAIVHEPLFAEHLPGAVVIPHGVEHVERADRAESRARLGLAAERLVVLCFGFVAPYKGLELACKAADLAGDGVQLVVAGGEHPRHPDTSYMARLRSRHDRHVRFTGFVPEDELAAWFAAADVVLLPYPRPHASSGALALALAHGTPVLLSPALARAVDAPAALAAPDDAAGLAERLRLLAAEPSKLELLRWASGHLAEGRSWPEVARRHLDLYREVSDARGAPAGFASAV